ncbi:hypothetical protein K503DRAFT_695677, partial [Rhizopogon vinicolor AM-OR11-026]
TPQAGPVKKVNYTVRALDCINCGTSKTLLWKRHDVGNNVCNACGLFHKLHGIHRPIKRRMRIPTAVVVASRRW